MNTVKQHIDLLGYEAVDKVTGFSGVITTMSFDLYGCIQLVLTPKAEDGRKYGESHWFDVARIEITSDERVMDLPDYDKGYIASGKKGAAEKPSMY